MSNKKEHLVEETIQRILNEIKEKFQEMQIYGVNQAFHFDKIRYIQSNKPNEIEMLYPMEKGTYNNWAMIKISENGDVHITGTQTSPEKRNVNLTERNGHFDVKVKLDDWKEPDTMEQIRREKLGKYDPQRGIFDLEENDSIIARIDTKYMWNKIDEKFPEVVGEDTFAWYGEALPKTPCIEYFTDGTELLIVTPEQATKLLTEYKNSLEQDKDTVLFADAQPGLASDCFDILLDNHLDIYVTDNKGILDETEESKKIKYERYKKVVIDCMEQGIALDGIINDDLMKDEEFIKALQKQEEKDELEKLREQKEALEQEERKITEIEKLIEQRENNGQSIE